MGDEVQERVADDLERYIEQLHSQRSARFPVNLASQDTHVYSMALFFHVASARIADPRTEFRAQLQKRLFEQIRAEGQLPGRSQGVAPTSLQARLPGIAPPARSQGVAPTLSQEVSPTRPQGINSESATASMAPSKSKIQLRTIFRQKDGTQPTHISPAHPEGSSKKKSRKQEITRRVLFARGTIAASGTIAAGVAIGGGIESFLEHQADHGSGTLVGTRWHPVTSLDQLGNAPMSFTTDTIAGYVTRQTKNGAPTGQILAFSAACTHLGCIVQWKNDQQTFDCPCHGSTFDATGQTLSRYPSLPMLETNVDEKGIISVKVP